MEADNTLAVAVSGMDVENSPAGDTDAPTNIDISIQEDSGGPVVIETQDPEIEIESGTETKGEQETVTDDSRIPDLVRDLVHDTIIHDGRKHSEDEPVTIVISRYVKLGMDERFSAWLEKATGIAKTFPGYESVTCLRPKQHIQGPQKREYTIIVRFSSVQLYRNWFNSDTHQHMLKGADELCFRAPSREIVSGFEPWLKIPEGENETPVGPKRWKQMFAVMLGIYPTNQLLQIIFRWIGLFTLPGWLVGLFLVPVMSLMMTYLVMPLVSWMLFPWLNPRVPRPKLRLLSRAPRGGPKPQAKGSTSE